MKKILFIVFCHLILSINFGQEFGEVSEEELKLNECLQEPDADVIILFDKCKVRITNNFDLETYFHKRIKILTEEGKEYANVKIRYWHEDDVNRLDAICYSQNGEEYELDSDNIYEEEGEKYYTISFAIPRVEVGSVIEYKYKLTSDYITRLEPWVFQDENFTKLSELTVQIPHGFRYSKISLNTEYYDFEEKIESVLNVDDPSKKVKQYTWIGRNLKGIKDEPFVDNLNDKYAKSYFILTSFRDRYQNITFAKTWDDVAERISKKYNDYIEQDDFTETKAKAITEGETDKLSIAKIIYDFVKSEIKLTKHKTLYGEEFKDPEKVLETKSGSSSDKNMLLINMLTCVGLDAKPILISTKKNGKVMPDFTESWQFNRLICKLKIDKKEYFLNAAYKANPFGYLTPSTDVGLGLLVNDDKGAIISLKPNKSLNKVGYITECEIHNNTDLKANTVIKYKGYSALIERINLKDEIESDIRKNIENLLENIYANIEIDTFYYDNIENYDEVLTLNIQYSIPDFIEEADDLSYIHVPLFSAISENPFKSEKRLYSVDFSYDEMVIEDVKLNMPEDYSVLELPEYTKLRVSDYTFSKSFFANKEYIKCTRIKNLRTRKIHQKFYKNIKKMYEGIVSSDEQQIVLKKIDNSKNDTTVNEG